MKRTILINQEVLFKIDKNLDFLDGAIMHYIIDFSHLAKKMLDQNRYWFWISSAKIIKDLPMLKIKTNRGVFNRIDKLIEANLLVRNPENKENGQSFYCFGDNYEVLIAWNETSTHGRNFPTPLEKPFQPPLNESSKYNSINDNSISDKKELNCEKAVSLNLFGSEIVEDKKAKIMMFKNSLVSVFEIFEKKFIGEEFKDVDINYYFHAVADWSLQKSTKVLRTNEGWIATARNWIRNDFKAGKLKVKSNSNTEEQYLEYLKDSNASN